MIEIPKTPIVIREVRKYSLLEILQYIILISLVLYYGKTLFIPLSFSLLISFILYPLCKWLETKGTTQSAAIFISILGLTILMGAVIYLLFLQIIEFSQEWQPLKEKLLETANQVSIFISERFGISLEEQSVYFKNSINNSGTQTISMVRRAAFIFSESIFYILIIPILSGLILYHRKILVNALYELFPLNKKETIHEILIQTIHAYYNFIKGMLLVYFIVGILNSIGLAIVGVPHPFLFGFIAAIMTFIPYVGIMISALLPIAVSWITFNSIWYPLAVIVVFALVQILEAYVIFPFAVGNRLKINTLVIIVMVLIGGIIWGTVGMILFIPFTSIVKLIADRTESLKSLSILLGDGNPEKK
jgi:predicted PurR-regulated permease PerM